MRVVVHCRPAGVHFHFARDEWHERLGLPTQRIVQSQFVHGHPFAIFAQNESQIVAEPHDALQKIGTPIQPLSEPVLIIPIPWDTV